MPHPALSGNVSKVSDENAAVEIGVWARRLRRIARRNSCGCCASRDNELRRLIVAVGRNADRRMAPEESLSPDSCLNNR